jgi:hypothetical protein
MEIRTLITHDNRIENNINSIHVLFDEPKVVLDVRPISHDLPGNMLNTKMSE